MTDEPRKERRDGQLPRICFIHLPKCAGTSIHNALKKHYPHNRIRHLRPGPARDAAASLKQGLDFRRSILAYHLCEPDVDLVIGHYQVTMELIDAHPEFDFVTVLREPIARFLSNFFYNQARPEWRELMNGHSLETFLNKTEAEVFGYSYLRFFGSEEPTSPDETARAKLLLSRFALVGSVEWMDTFVADFEDRYGMRLDIGNDNTGPNTLDRPEFSEETLSKIREICAPNRALYDFVVPEQGTRR